MATPPTSSAIAIALSRIRGLYGMVDLQPGEGHRAVPLASALLDGGARVLQLRMKRADAREILVACEALRPVCAGRATLIVNDRLDVALAAAADGVHLGQSDLPLAAARRLVPPGMLIGISTHDEAQALAAARGGADYIGFGPVFGTKTKEKPDPTTGVEALAAVCRAVRIPVVGIGSIAPDNVGEIVRAGAAAAAVISAVNHAPDPTRAARLITEAFERPLAEPAPA